MKVRERHINKIEKALIRRIAQVETRLADERARADRATDRAAELLHERNIWRRQASRLADFLPECSAKGVPELEVSEPDTEEADLDDEAIITGLSQIGEYLGITSTRAKDEIRQGRLKVMRSRGRVCAPLSALNTWLLKQSPNILEKNHGQH